MAGVGSIEVPIKVSPARIIPFHENEIYRVEMERTSLIFEEDGMIVPVRARDCDVIVNGNRVRNCQCAVVVGPRPGRPDPVLGFVTRVRRDDEAAHAQVAWLAGLEDGSIEAHLLIRHPDDGRVLRTFSVVEGSKTKRLIEDGTIFWFDVTGKQGRNASGNIDFNA